MLNPSEIQLDRSAVSADHAQILRGSGPFGAVAFKDGPVLRPDQVRFELGYADCLPIRGGGCWRDPASPATTETMR